MDNTLAQLMRIDLTRMECKEERGPDTIPQIDGIDLTRMECKECSCKLICC